MTDLDFLYKYWSQLLFGGSAIAWFARLEARIVRVEEKRLDLASVLEEKLSNIRTTMDKDMELIKQQRADDHEVQDKQRATDHAENERRWSAATSMLNEVRLDVKQLLGRKNTP